MGPMESVRVLIIDDHAMFREGVTRLLENEPGIEIAGQCSSAEDGLASLTTSSANLLLLDVELGPERALDFVLEARKRGYSGRVLVLTAGVSGAEAVQLIRSGVAGIVHKQQSASVLRQAIERVSRGEAWLEESYLAALFRSVDRSRTPEKTVLTERERKLLRFIFQGLTNKEIAVQLNLSEGTVKASLRQLFDKLKVRTRAQAVKVALEQYKHEL